MTGAPPVAGMIRRGEVVSSCGGKGSDVAAEGGRGVFARRECSPSCPDRSSRLHNPLQRGCDKYQESGGFHDSIS